MLADRGATAAPVGAAAGKMLGLDDVARGDAAEGTTPVQTFRPDAPSRHTRSPETVLIRSAPVPGKTSRWLCCSEMRTVAPVPGTSGKAPATIIEVGPVTQQLDGVTRALLTGKFRQAVDPVD
jgi:hypothetical protein